MSSKGDVEVLEYIVKIISSNLEELLNINASVRYSSSPESLQKLALIAESTRDKILELVEKAIEILENTREPLPEEVVSDLFTLSGYYYLQGYKTDVSAMNILSKSININYNNIIKLREKFGKLYRITRDSLKG